jgi:hypothetical protein
MTAATCRSARSSVPPSNQPSAHTPGKWSALSRVFFSSTSPARSRTTSSCVFCGQGGGEGARGCQRLGDLLHAVVVKRHRHAAADSGSGTQQHASITPPRQLGARTCFEGREVKGSGLRRLAHESAARVASGTDEPCARAVDCMWADLGGFDELRSTPRTGNAGVAAASVYTDAASLRRASAPTSRSAARTCGANPRLPMGPLAVRLRAGLDWRDAWTIH